MVSGTPAARIPQLEEWRSGECQGLIEFKCQIRSNIDAQLPAIQFSSRAVLHGSWHLGIFASLRLSTELK